MGNLAAELVEKAARAVELPASAVADEELRSGSEEVEEAPDRPVEAVTAVLKVNMEIMFQCLSKISCSECSLLLLGFC